MMSTSCPRLGLTVVIVWLLRLGGMATVGSWIGELSAASVAEAPTVQVKGSPKRLAIVGDPGRTWYLIDRDDGLRLDVSGPGYLPIEIRRNLPLEKQDSYPPMVAIVELDNRVILTYSARPMPSQERYADNESLIPAEPERVQLLIPKGKHTSRIRLESTDEHGLVVALDHSANAEFSGCVCDARIALPVSFLQPSTIQSARKTERIKPVTKSTTAPQRIRAAAPITLPPEARPPQLVSGCKNCEDTLTAAEILDCPERLTIANEPDQQWCRISKEAGLKLKMVGPGYLRVLLRRNLPRDAQGGEKPLVVVGEMDGRIRWSADIAGKPSGQRYLELEELLPAEAERIHVHVPAGEHVGVVRLATTDADGVAASLEECAGGRMLTTGCGGGGACGSCGSFCGDSPTKSPAESVLADVDARHLTNDSLRQRFDEAVTSQTELYLTTLVHIGAIQSSKVTIHVQGEPGSDVEVADADVQVDHRKVVISEGASEGKAHALAGREDLLPGPHRVEAAVRFRHARNAVFNYVQEETYQVKGARVFVAEAGKYYDIRFVLHMTGDFTTLFKDRVAMRIDVQPTAGRPESPAASVQNTPSHVND